MCVQYSDLHVHYVFVHTNKYLIMNRMCPWTFILKAHPLSNLDAEFSFLHDFLDTNARESHIETHIDFTISWSDGS